MSTASTPNTPKTDLVLASGNTGKLVELQTLLAPLGFNLLAQNTLGVASAPEPFYTFVENALAKARHASQCTGLPAIADDSGLCIHAWNGQPGVDTAYYATRLGYTKGDTNNILALLEQMQAQGLTQAAQRKGAMVSTLVALRTAQDPEPLIAIGRVQIQIANAPRGNNGFGLDSILELPDQNRTFAQLANEQKNRISHRALAGQRMLELLRTNWC